MHCFLMYLNYVEEAVIDAIIGEVLVADSSVIAFWESLS